MPDKTALKEKKFSVRLLSAFVIPFCIVLLDQWSKSAVTRIFSLNQSKPVLSNIFHLTLVHNTGGAFGFFSGHNIIFLIFSSFLSLTIVLYIFRVSRIESFALGLILGGAWGNLIDRYRFGYVIDFFDFRVWPVFNIADSFITAGAILLILFALFAPRTVE